MCTPDIVDEAPSVYLPEATISSPSPFVVAKPSCPYSTTPMYLPVHHSGRGPGLGVGPGDWTVSGRVDYTIGTRRVTDYFSILNRSPRRASIGFDICKSPWCSCIRIPHSGPVRGRPGLGRRPSGGLRPTLVPGRPSSLRTVVVGSGRVGSGPGTDESPPVRFGLSSKAPVLLRRRKYSGGPQRV